MNRRNFLKIAGLATAGVATGALPGKSLASVNHFEGNPDRKGVLVDTTQCIGLNCRRCELACAKQHGLPTPSNPPEDPTVFDQPRRTHADQFTVVNRYPGDSPDSPIYCKTQCMHCDEPACASACLVGAFSKSETGAVHYDASVCIGCRYCMVACPFSIPTYEYDRALHPRVRKCTFCLEERLEEGKPPACVEACPREVMTFGRREDLIKLARQRIARNPDKYVDHIYGEHEVGGTSWMYLSSKPFDQIGFRTDLGTIPYPELTRNYLSAAPLVMAIWPTFFLSVYLFTKRKEQLAEQNGNKANGNHRMKEEK
ncbi:MAG: 4Fe-4S dicluster domain-containing protein [Calditrichaeota bacterium]|nr:4Fe-4S dicluster domain-containing protein [Calditrichota bacterium]MCB9367066.1 4Fe-4S dicluster domain-containing protein [Calditrichota bacterium]MCB9391450.1 4Fe-4S dicluster domain-containing protein [Calditrichota bacterium]